MSFVLGREAGREPGPTAHLGHYRARDGSSGAAVHLDIDGPHATLVVGKRGYGKTYTLGVLAEALARTAGIAPVIIDPMGEFTALPATARTAESVTASVLSNPTIPADALDPRAWCDMLELSPESGVGGLVWQAATTEPSLSEMCASIQNATAPETDTRAARNHLALADSWGIFDPDGLTAADLASSDVTVVDLAGMDRAPMNAVVRAIAETCYQARLDSRIDRLPWLLVDEAHTFFDGVAGDALRTILTRGRAPGVSLMLATQRPSAIPPVGISQSDLLLAHRLTSGADLDALERAQPTYMDSTLTAQLPTAPGDVVAIDDATETVHAIQIRERETPHEGDSPRASEVALTSS